jgi:hypothetical protein
MLDRANKAQIDEIGGISGFGARVAGGGQVEDNLHGAYRAAQDS